MMAQPPLRPHAVHDLRGTAIEEVRYPADAVLMVAGIPGAGKSTLLHRVFRTDLETGRTAVGAGDAAIVDSLQGRNRWRRWLGRAPYPVWRPIVHLTHYRRIRAAISAVSGPVVVHECGTRSWTRDLIRRWAVRRRRTLHLLLLDVDPAIALAGQRSRRRSIGSRSFSVHCRRWERLLAGVMLGDASGDTASVTIIDRPAADGLRRIEFGSRTTFDRT